MKRLYFIVLLTLTTLSAFVAFAQDDLIFVKEKDGVTKIKDKTKPLRREFEAIYAEGVQNLKSHQVEAQLARISPRFIAVLPDGQIMNYEAIASYIRRGAEQFVDIGDLRITLESLTLKDGEVIVEARQYFPRKQRLSDGKLHEVFSSVLQTETWEKTPEGWKKRRVENLREQSLTVDGVPRDPAKPFDPGAPPVVPKQKP